MLAAGVFGIAALFFVITSVGALVALRHVRRLPPLDVTPFTRPRVSIVFAARDEVSRVAATSRHALDQTHCDVEVIAVSDRSTDGTDAVLASLAALDARLHPLRVDRLPDGWLGKCYACSLGADAATGDWILFTDADCWLSPDAVARAIVVAERDGVDHVTLTPGIKPRTAVVAAWHLVFLVSILDWVARTNTDRPGAHVGIGAFNLIRASAYRRTGGYDALRLSVVDDVKLGLLVRRSGMRSRAFIGGDDVECQWGEATLGGQIKLMEKNYFAAVDYRSGMAIGAGLFMTAVWTVAVAGLFTGTMLGLTAGAALLLLTAPAVVLASRLQWPMRWALLTPLIFVTLPYALLRSVVVTLRQGGVRWRDTFYPLAVLRAGNVDRLSKVKK